MEVLKVGRLMPEQQHIHHASNTTLLHWKNNRSKQSHQSTAGRKTCPKRGVRPRKSKTQHTLHNLKPSIPE